tara:strand:- start:15300 stop:16058 length:759 start_codon:yes stop_codon:yes gene_type:complete
MDKAEPEIHPLDRDYSDDAPVPSRSPIPRSTNYHAKLRRFGVIVFGLGFIGLFPAAIFLNNARGNATAESVASMLHQLSMLVILVGGVMVFAAYRWPHLSKLINAPSSQLNPLGRSPFVTLLIWNVVAFVAIVVITTLMPSQRSYEFLYLLLSGIFTSGLGLLITMIVWHRGMLRGYAIGAMAALIVNGFSLLSVIGGGFGRGNSTFILNAQIATVLVSGLISAGYVSMIQSYRVKQQLRDSVEPHDSALPN